MESQQIGAGQRVLIVDDNLDAAETLGMVLELDGYEIRTVPDGRSALEALPAFEPQVVLLDIGLPDLDGYEVARRMRATEPGKKALLFALTGWGQEDDKRRAAAAGFDAHLTKPVDADSLTALFEQKRGR